MMRLTIRGLAASVVPTCGKDPSEHAIKLFDRQIFAHVAIRAGAQRRMHLLLIITDSGENNDRNLGINFADEGNERNSIYLWHFKIDDHHVAIVVGEPGGGLEAVGERVASVPALAEISDEELGDPGIVVDNKKLRTISIERRFHSGL